MLASASSSPRITSSVSTGGGGGGGCGVYRDCWKFRLILFIIIYADQEITNFASSISNRPSRISTENIVVELIKMLKVKTEKISNVINWGSSDTNIQRILVVPSKKL